MQNIKEPAKIEDDVVVSMAYVLTVDGEVLDSTEEGESLQFIQAVFLHADVVGVVHVVHAYHGVAVFYQKVDHSGGDEPGRPGDKIAAHKKPTVFLP